MFQRSLLLILLITGAFQNFAQAPSNDDCNNAITIPLQPFDMNCAASVSASTANATASTPAPSCVPADDDIWYAFTATSSSIIFRYSNVQNMANGSTAAPSFALYEGACPAGATGFFCGAVNVAGSGFRIMNGLTIGATYYLRIWSLSAGIAMSIDFCVQAVPPAPSNNDCSGATPIATLAPGSACTSPIQGSTVGATLSTPSASCGGSSQNDDIWYSFTANTNAITIQYSNARLATSNGNANVGYALYSGTCPTTTTTIACSSGLGALSGTVTIGHLTPGATYFLRFFSVADNNYMTFEFCVIDVILTANDECENALPVTTFTLGEPATPTEASTASSTRSVPDPSCTSVEDNDDIWYRFTSPTASIVLSVDDVVNNRTGGGGTVGFALYQAPCPTTTATIACNNIVSAGSGVQIINGLIPGQEYYLRFWSTLTAGETVSFKFLVQDVPAAMNDECTNALPVNVLAAGSACRNSTHASTTGATRSLPDPDCSTFNDDDIYYSFVATGKAVLINFSNASTVAGSGSATLGFAVQPATCPTSSATIGCQSNFGTGSGTALVGGLTPGETYFLRFFSYDVNNYIQFDFCVVDAPLPPNDECSNAIALPVSNGFCTSPVVGHMANATPSAGMGAPACAASAANEDIWFTTTVPATGNVVIQTSVAGHFAIEDLVMEAYSGACGSLSLIACDDDGNPEPAPNDKHCRISLSGRTPGELVYLRVIKKFSLVYDAFAICAWDPSVILPASDGGSCVPGNNVTIDAASGNQYMWVPVLDATGKIIAEINANGSALNTVLSNVFVNTSGTVREVSGHPYLDRNITLSPQTNGSARLRLYFKSGELQALISADKNITGLPDLKITKTSTACGPQFSGGGIPFAQSASGNYGTGHFIEFSVPSFSSFFIDGGAAALPLEFVWFEATKQNGQVMLHWMVVQDRSIEKFEVQRSQDGVSFVPIGEKRSGDFISELNSNWQYTYNDATAIEGTVFYRIKMMDQHGRAVYSKVVAMNSTASNSPALKAYPNPVSRFLVISMPSTTPVTRISLFNSAGLLLRQVDGPSSSNGLYTLDLQHLPPGLYILQVSTGRKNQWLKVVKR